MDYNSQHSISKIKERDTCLALTFLLLILWFFIRSDIFVYIGMGMLLFGMIWPRGMQPLAYIWFGLSMILGKIMSIFVLTIIYVIILLPVAIIRRLIGKDPLGLKKFGVGKGSCFVERNYTFVADDLTNPY